MPYIDVSYTVPIVVRVYVPEIRCSGCETYFPETDKRDGWTCPACHASDFYEVGDEIPEVDRVVVVDEAVSLDRDMQPYDMAQAGNMDEVPEPLATRAIEIAETYEWPSWEYGW